MDKEEFLEKALKANEQEIGQAKFSDLTDKGSTYYQGLNLPPKEPVAVESKPAADPEEIPRIRTFQADITDAVKTDQLSSSRIALAEAKKENSRDEPDRPKKSAASIVLVVLGIMFVIGGLGAIGYAVISKYKVVEVGPVTEADTALIHSDSKTLIPIGGSTLRSFQAAIQKELKDPPSQDELREIRFINNTEDKQESTVVDFLLALESRVPEESIRSLDAKFYFGVNFIKGKGEPVFIIKGESYETLFPGLLRWESNMLEDLAPIFVSQTASSTAPSEFQDRIIFNKDARISLNPDGSVRFFYTIEDDVFAIFAKSPETLEEILKRLREAKIAN